ncbi:hypothetical protein BC833DRAFT_594922 [Globomyces pollinis-pini]|nr:hypothetical protein BC833DRAFT_594922 [Globomyces pollinis-pini]
MGEKKVSTSTGNKKFQRHKNKTAFVPNKFSQIALKIANTPIAGVCAKCKEILQWKQRMGKYKPLTQPKTCLICHKKSIVQAYHVICQPCQKVKRVCAKCHESTEIESETPKTNAEQMKSDQEFELKIASLSERQKRSYLRKIDRGLLFVVYFR